MAPVYGAKGTLYTLPGRRRFVSLPAQHRNVALRAEAGEVARTLASSAPTQTSGMRCVRSGWRRSVTTAWSPPGPSATTRALAGSGSLWRMVNSGTGGSAPAGAPSSGRIWNTK